MIFLSSLLAVSFIAVPAGVSDLATMPHLAQSSADPYSDWIFLYEDTFEGASGAEVTQRWWLNPSFSRQGETLRFQLLARRQPVSDNGTAAGQFDYIADCASLSYALEQAAFLDADNRILDSQTYRSSMQPATPEMPIHSVLSDLCLGVYGN